MWPCRDLWSLQICKYQCTENKTSFNETKRVSHLLPQLYSSVANIVNNVFSSCDVIDAKCPPRSWQYSSASGHVSTTLLEASYSKPACETDHSENRNQHTMRLQSASTFQNRVYSKHDIFTHISVYTCSSSSRLERVHAIHFVQLTCSAVDTAVSIVTHTLVRAGCVHAISRTNCVAILQIAFVSL